MRKQLPGSTTRLNDNVVLLETRTPFVRCSCGRALSTYFSLVAVCARHNSARFAETSPVYFSSRPRVTDAQALETLGRFETMTATLESESKLLSSARDALSLDPMERDVLGPIQAEISDLREVKIRSVVTRCQPLEEMCWAWLYYSVRLSRKCPVVVILFYPLLQIGLCTCERS